MACTHHHSAIKSGFITKEFSGLCLFIYPSFPTTDHFTVYTVSPFSGSHIVGGEVHWASGVPMSQLGDPQARYPHWHLGRLPGGVCNAVSRICIALMSSGCYSLRLTFHLRVVKHTSVFCMGKKEVGVFGRILYSWGSPLRWSGVTEIEWDCSV